MFGLTLLFKLLLLCYLCDFVFYCGVIWVGWFVGLVGVGWRFGCAYVGWLFSFRFGFNGVGIHSLYCGLLLCG